MGDTSIFFMSNHASQDLPGLDVIRSRFQFPALAAVLKRACENAGQRNGGIKAGTCSAIFAVDVALRVGEACVQVVKGAEMWSDADARETFTGRIYAGDERKEVVDGVR